MNWNKWLPFGESDDGCDGHHWGEWRSESQWRVEKRFSAIVVEEKKLRRCQHADCIESDREWHREATVAPEEWETALGSLSSEEGEDS